MVKGDDKKTNIEIQEMFKMEIRWNISTTRAVQNDEIDWSEYFRPGPLIDLYHISPRNQ